VSQVSINGGAPSGSGSSIVAPPGGGGHSGAIAVEQAGAPIVADASALNFTGEGVTVTDGGEGTATIAIPGGGGGVAVFNVKDYGAIGNGIADDTAAIRAAIAASVTSGGGTIYFPNGTYIVSQQTDTACLIIPSNTTLFGQSKESAIIKLAAGQPAFTRPILVGVVGGAALISDVRIANLTIDGNKAEQPDDDEHRAAIFLYNTARVLIEDMNIHDNTGDAIDIFETTETVVQRCYCYDNDRKAVTIDGGPNSYMSVKDCYFENNNGQLHIESDTTCQYLWFEDTYCGEPSQGGVPVSMGGAGEHLFLRGLEILGGLAITNVSDCHVSNCHVITGPQGADGPAPLAIQDNVSQVTITNCIFEQTADQGSNNYIGTIQGSSAVSPDRPANIILQYNTFVTDYFAANGIAIINVQDVQLIGNRITQTVASSGIGIGVSSTDIEYSAPQTGTVILDGNYIENWAIGIGVGGTDSTFKIGALIANNNTIAAGPINASKCYDLGPELPSSVPYSGLEQCSLVGNDSIGVTQPFASYPAGCPILIGGVRGGGGIYNCAGSPNGQITESVSAQAMQRDGSGSIVGWIKTSGSGATGWQSINVT
jgi:hypothetical protein